MSKIEQQRPTTPSPARWYADPHSHGWRWWNGTEWRATQLTPPPVPLRFTTPWTVEQTQTAMAQHLASSGAQISAAQPGWMSGSVSASGTPSVLGVIVLLVFFLLPAIIYLIIVSRPKPYAFALQIIPTETGALITTSGVGAGILAVNRAAAAIGQPT